MTMIEEDYDDFTTENKYHKEALQKLYNEAIKKYRNKTYAYNDAVEYRDHFLKDQVHISWKLPGYGSTNFVQLLELVEIFKEVVGIENNQAITIETKYERGYYDDVSAFINVVGTRLKTSEELLFEKEQAEKKSRIAKEAAKKAAETKKANELKEYERLKKKFGDA